MSSPLGPFLRENTGLLGAIAAGSVVFVIAGAALGPLIIRRLPEDYFTPDVMNRRGQPGHSQPGRGPRALLVRVLRNIAGWLLLLLGLVLLVLPGQGILTIIAALALMDFPMKRRLMQKILQTKQVRSALDWLRTASGKEPFRWE